MASNKKLKEKVFKKRHIVGRMGWGGVYLLNGRKKFSDAIIGPHTVRADFVCLFFFVFLGEML